MSSSDFYSLTPILEKGAQYNLIIGERSNGKTYASLKYGLEKFVETGQQMAYLRRWKEDYRGKRGETLFASLVANDEVSQLTDGKFTRISYYSGKWYLANYDEKLDKIIRAPEPFCYAFALSDMEHDKSTSYPNITTIVFDEFLTRTYYLVNEFVLFMNVLSTIIRHRDNVKIFMLGNTVNKYCPYFKEMGLKHVETMEQGAIDVYRYGNSDLKVAVEYCAPIKKEGKKSDIYFTFDSPSLAMITGGAWEIDIYPHCPRKYTKNDVVFEYFIDFDDHLLHGEVVVLDDCTFTFIHEKTTELKHPDTDLVYSSNYDPRPNYVRNLTHPINEATKNVYKYFKEEKVYYQDNEVGELVRNYLNTCKNG